MVNMRVIEIMVGVFVAIGIAAVIMLTMKVSNISGMMENDSYHLTMRFDNVGGLKVLSPVSIGGVKVGRVTDIQYDQEAYEALVSVAVYSRFDRLPLDTVASIYTSGLLGEQYIGLEAGGEEEYLKNGDVIFETQSALIIEQLVGDFLFNKTVEE